MIEQERAAAVLVVDDEAADRTRIREILESQGYRVWEASDYETAALSFDQHRAEIDLLLVDVSLPRKNGCELAKALLRLNPHLKVLFVSGDAGAKLIRFYGIRPTDLHFLRKPIRHAMLSQRIQKVLESEDPLTLGGSEASG